MIPAVLAPPPGASPVRLLCFHHAGGGASAFTSWAHALGPHWELFAVRLPGRESRLLEPRVTRHEQLLAELDAGLGPLPHTPYVLYGHSLGALVAYAFAQHRSRLGHPPLAVLVGACPPPHAEPPPLTADADDRRLLAALGRLGGMPAEVLGRAGILRRALDLIRDDLRLAQNLRAVPHEPLAVPLYAFAGDRDPMADHATMRGWSHCTTGPFDCHDVPGGHFFHSDPDFLVLLRTHLARLPTGLSRAFPEPSTDHREAP
ncbi:thioesterase domain-containing protein [Streptomyces canus]|uniref:thioesterase II family protein n=1 Tax=Streptomyces canus TaxID=58343 RepID=UPI00225BDC11|nr:alpha/beta fold hydrolase [Streptomyces canus]MCX4856325.1 thioesterase domain-containing protein [Streptomyces canus]WSW38207.1 thioesterase domain-containing protein [Streptomyces canus]